MKSLFFIVKLFFSVFISLILCLSAYTILLNERYHYQAFLYVLASFFIIIGFLYIIFFKTEKHVKIIFCILILIHIFVVAKLPKVKRAFAKDTCLDIGICKEGLEIRNAEGNIVKINKENCLKYNWSWNEERKSCDVRAGSR